MTIISHRLRSSFFILFFAEGAKKLDNFSIQKVEKLHDFCYKTMPEKEALFTCTMWYLKHFYISVGTAGIILQAPTLYDTRPAIDTELSNVGAPTVKPPTIQPLIR
jgi:hypothetical protein